MKYGYVKTPSQKTADIHIKEITEYGVDQLFCDVVPSRQRINPEYDRLMTLLKEGDEIIAYERKRVAKTYEEWASFVKRGIQIVGLHDAGLCPAEEFPEFLIAFHDILVKDESEEGKFQTLLQRAFREIGFLCKSN